MKFEQALLEGVRKYKYIKRAKWLDSYAFTWGRKPDWCESGFITKSGCCSKALSDTDIMAEDWNSYEGFTNQNIVATLDNVLAEGGDY